MQNTIWKPIRTNPNFVVLDTETTGLGYTDEICEIAVVNSQGQTLLDTLVKPTQPIPSGATDIHGITDSMVSDAPSFSEVFDTRLSLILEKHLCVIYNQQFDLRLISQSLVNNHSDALFPKQSRFFCAMEAYAEFHGEWDVGRNSYSWQRLTSAMTQQSLVALPDAHRALFDCKMTLDLVNHCALAEVSRHAS